jgi:predicted O-linked N-acetylglucosamine transferase (SPINDLY family)
VSSPQTDFSSKISLAWQRKLSLNELIEFAAQLDACQEYTLEAVIYQTWLARNDTPMNHVVYFNLGAALFRTDDLEGAKNAYLQAMERAPGFVHPHFNIGSVYERLNQPEMAISEWLWVVSNASVQDEGLRPIRLLALNNLGRVYEDRKQYAEALFYLTKSLDVDPEQGDVLHHWVFLRERLCEWPIYAPVKDAAPELMRQSTSALAMLSISDDPEAQLISAKNYVKNNIKSVAPLSPSGPYGHQKLRIGYLSSDFCLHPVSMLTAELFELHDRKHFEAFAYCWSIEDGSAMRQRVIKAMDHFERINGLDDASAAKLIREHEIDILIDLHGQTLGARPNLLAYRPAPVQITYLGLPATTGFPFVDYFITDKFLTPKESARFFSEKPLYMPDVFQVSDRQRVNGPIPARKDCGLPEDGFVFCSFNNNYKYTPEVFAVWMNILRRVPQSVLWLLADNQWAEANLRKEVLKHGIDPNRLVFAARVAPENYLARYGVADLFLDSFPFNGGTTANDALWMGLPVLTCSGRSFASRMAGSLLTAAQLDELITYNLRDYEEKAVALANTPGQCERFKAHLNEVRMTGTLFDTPRFVRHLEKSFKRILGAAGRLRG